MVFTVLGDDTSRLLRQEGYECHDVEDAEAAIEILQESRFDVLITDIRMPHNRDMRLVRMAQQLDPDMAVIVATGYPSTETAIRAVKLPVVAYMPKPLDFDELLEHLGTSVKSSKRRRAIAAVVERLQTCLADLEVVRSQPPRSNDGNDEVIPTATIRTLAACLSELLNMSAKAASDKASCSLCELLDCPQEPLARQAILEAIGVLKKTRDTFKSKPLAVLREKLEHLVGRLSES